MTKKTISIFDIQPRITSKDKTLKAKRESPNGVVSIKYSNLFNSRKLGTKGGLDLFKKDFKIPFKIKSL